MSAEPAAPTWFPDRQVDPSRVTVLSMILMQTSKVNGFSRETYAVAVAQMAEALVGHEAEQDLDGEVLRFVAERFRAVADAMDRSTN